MNAIRAHKSSNPSVLAFNAEGSKIASASTSGTVVRVFDLPTGQLLGSYRRGSIPACIYSLAFDPTGSYLCVSSDTGTIHVFDVTVEEELKKTSTGGGPQSNHLGGPQPNDLGGPPPNHLAHAQPPSGSLLSQFLRTSSATLSTFVDGSSRDLAYIRLRTPGIPNIVAMVPTVGRAEAQVLVITANGYFYQYLVHLEGGGQGRLERVSWRMNRQM